MNTSNNYDTKSAKELLLLRASRAYYTLGLLNSKMAHNNTQCEEELITYAMNKTLEKDTYKWEQYIELIGLSFMLQGITENLLLEISKPIDLLSTEPF